MLKFIAIGTVVLFYGLILFFIYKFEDPQDFLDQRRSTKYNNNQEEK